MDVPQYDSQAYWDQRYAQDASGQFEWLQTYDELRPVLQPFLQKDSEILVIGCGNSAVGERLHEDGFVNVTCIDTSPVVVQQMSERCAQREEMEFNVMDATALDFPDDCFSVVLDKATTDTILCGEDCFTKVNAVLQEVWRVLMPGGVYVIISYAGPEKRVPLFEASGRGWSVQVARMPKPHVGVVQEQLREPPGASHFAYLLTKPDAARS